MRLRGENGRSAARRRHTSEERTLIFVNGRARVVESKVDAASLRSLAGAPPHAAVFSICPQMEVAERQDIRVRRGMIFRVEAA
jgi:hypothetical protein